MQPPFSRTAYELLLEQAQRAPDALAVITRTESTTYQALAQRAGRVAAALRSRGIRRGDAIGLILDNRIEWLEIFFGAAALGAVVVPFSTWSKRAELDFLLRDSGVRCLFSLDRFGDQEFARDIAALLQDRRRFPRLEQLVLLGAEPMAGWAPYSAFRDCAPLEPLPPGEGASARDTALVLYTSGSSSRPKAVPLDHFGIIENGFNIGERQGLRPADRVLVAPPLFWAYGGINALPATLTHGATLVLQSRFEPGEALDLIERFACTSIYTLPAMTNALLAHPQFSRERTRSLRTGLTIGSPQDVVKAAEQLGAHEICNVYGQTETYGNCCVTWHHWPLERRAACQGHPLPGVSVRIVDPQSGETCAPGEQGHVEVKGYQMRSYAGASAAQSAGAFSVDGYFRTGDLGSLAEDGTFMFAGRTSEMIKRSGINVSPAEIEDILQQHPQVGLAGVTGLPDVEKGEIIIAFVVPKPGSAPAPEALIAHCRAMASRYKIPDRIAISDALPLTVTGKVMRRELKALAEQRYATPAKPGGS
ncbi:MAG: class I adenylate-forming enzyme family protein [Bacteroidota bacterium]|jgi:fatty-acyl-CoA synthase